MIEDFRARLSGSLRGLARTVLRSLWTPTRSEYVQSAIAASDDPARLLSQILGPITVDITTQLFEPTSGQFSVLWPLEPEARQFLRGFVRSVRPKRFLETGVADGVSSRIILDALEENGDGRLCSVDVHPQAGKLARASPAVHRWQFVALPRRGRAAAFRRTIHAWRPLDVFLHDSDHSYPWQTFEYREAWSALAPGGWLLSDDIDGSYAFLDFAVGHELKPWVLLGSRRLFGILRKPE
ncbi:MAG: class I SAM-dependent methyltransferase [Thermoplasmata archaeon]